MGRRYWLRPKKCRLIAQSGHHNRTEPCPPMAQSEHSLDLDENPDRFTVAFHRASHQGHTPAHALVIAVDYLERCVVRLPELASAGVAARLASVVHRALGQIFVTDHVRRSKIAALATSAVLS